MTAAAIDAPLPTPWAAIGLLVLGITLLGIAARADTSPGLRAARPAAVVLVVVGVISLAASVVVAIRS